MGKRRQITSEEEQRDSTATGSTSPKKKHKHKHKKHKRKRELTESESLVEDDMPKKKKHKRKEKTKDEGRSLKLKIKLGGRTLATKQVLNITPMTLQQTSPLGSEDELGEHEYPVTLPEPWKAEEQQSTVDVKPIKSSEDQEEEEWLDALEAGELDDYGRMKQQKDTSMMTARQRAMLGHEIVGESELLELPTEVRRKDEDSEEALKRRKQRAKKRKQQMEKQIEEDKAQTIERLLNKQVRSRKEAEKQRRIQKSVVPRVTYLNNSNGISISFPVNTDIPFKKQVSDRVPKEKVTCSVQGCKNIKQYSCSKTQLPLCSLECYKKVQHTSVPGIA